MRKDLKAIVRGVDIKKITISKLVQAIYHAGFTVGYEFGKGHAKGGKCDSQEGWEKYKRDGEDGDNSSQA